MKRILQSIILIATICLGTPTFAATQYPVDEPMGGELFGHSVKNIGDGIYVFRWWIYRNIFIVTDEGVIATDPMNPKAAKLLKAEIEK